MGLMGRLLIFEVQRYLLLLKVKFRLMPHTRAKSTYQYYSTYSRKTGLHKRRINIFISAEC
jgi:hypothetical protein